ncbi:stage II sporulation protein P [Filibacter tadaridae]|uniref:Stage II sporulation protein P (SpoIIP) n=1 Tax=Filibacter tadaridae TaxID=2483811 RepID=A0A3P5XFR1_9BACL|nr:stage II sporulation protein P [Filibacter tadaridae]VDC27456.1 Stage II sporulation protein P (SpoIIP) [Filibacter tadaridae]
MRTDNELFDILKDAHSYTPSKEFVSNTETRLRQIARKSERKRRYKYYSFAATGMALCAIAFSWVFLLGGHEVINTAISVDGQSNSVPAVTQQESAVYIYHTHNHESFNPEINGKEGIIPEDESKNITLVGKRLKSSLEEKDINVIHDSTDVVGITKGRGLTFNKTYDVSREPLEKSLQTNSNIKMVLDIHRDSIARKDSTLVSNGKDYAKVAFIVSQTSKNYKENVEFAEQLHTKFNQKYPGISRGVIVKNNVKNGQIQSTYNQDLVGQSVLMNVGGIDSTLEEAYRTADILSEIIEEIIKNK